MHHTEAASAHTAAKPVSLQFVTFSDPKDSRSAATVSKIRKHAMKEVGRSRRKRKRHDSNADLPDTLLPTPDPRSMAIHTGAIDAFVQLPVALGDVGKQLVINSGFPQNLCRILFTNALAYPVFNDDQLRHGQYALRRDWFTVGLQAGMSMQEPLRTSGCGRQAYQDTRVYVQPGSGELRFTHDVPTKSSFAHDPGCYRRLLSPAGRC